MPLLDADQQARVRRGLRLHVIVALVVIMAMIAINFLTTPRYPWWMWVAVAWAAPLAVHAAIAMELFGRKD